MNLNLFLIVREAQKRDQSAQGFTGNSFRREKFNQLSKRLLCNQKDLISFFYSVRFLNIYYFYESPTDCYFCVCTRVRNASTVIH